jgi:3-phosphoshikimate 1-carboxyvinyltransferase
MYRITAPERCDIEIDLPASKSVTHRILILAALNYGNTFISQPLKAEDTDITLRALQNMGAETVVHADDIEVIKPIGIIKNDDIFLGNSGSSARFLIPLAALLDKSCRFFGHDRLHQRPFAELFDALRQLNVRIECENNTLPAVINPAKIKGGRIKLADLPSSQIITALMMSALWMENDLEIVLPAKTPSLPYIKMTYRLMKRMGLGVDYRDNLISVVAGRPDLDWNFKVEKDFSAASYWVIYSMIHGIKLVLPGVTLPSLQGDERIFSIADILGAEIMLFSDRLEITGKLKRGMNIDCNEIPDLVPALSVLAMFAPEESHLKNVKHLEYKESNRIEAIQSNISALGGRSEYDNGDLRIVPQKKYEANIIESYNDHRIAMSFAIAGTKIPGTIIKNPDCVKKSYPAFWQHFRYWQGLENE